MQFGHAVSTKPKRKQKYKSKQMFILISNDLEKACLARELERLRRESLTPEQRDK
jgi:hypothetical protein